MLKWLIETLVKAGELMEHDVLPLEATCSMKINKTGFVSKQVIMEMTDGGADYCFECVGMASLVHEAYACCRMVSFILHPPLSFWTAKHINSQFADEKMTHFLMTLHVLSQS